MADPLSRADYLKARQRDEDAVAGETRHGRPSFETAEAVWSLLVQPLGLDIADLCHRRHGKFPDLHRQVLVIANVPSATAISYAFFIRTHKGQAIPRRTRVLSSGDGPVSLYRADARSVLVQWQGRQERMWFRIRPFDLHERIRLAGTDIEITRLTESGWPAEALFRFDAELETLKWVRWEPGGFVGFRPPAVGETIVLP